MSLLVLSMEYTTLNSSQDIFSVPDMKLMLITESPLICLNQE